MLHLFELTMPRTPLLACFRDFHPLDTSPPPPVGALPLSKTFLVPLPDTDTNRPAFHRLYVDCFQIFSNLVSFLVFVGFRQC